MRRQRLRAFSPWPSAASLTALKTALFTALSLAHYFWLLASCSWFQACPSSTSTPFGSGHSFSSESSSRFYWNGGMRSVLRHRFEDANVHSWPLEPAHRLSA